MINGIYAATLSLLNDDLGLDIKNTISHAEKVIDNGCHGVVFFGSTGQSQLISLAEKVSSFSILVSQIDGLDGNSLQSAALNLTSKLGDKSLYIRINL